MQTGQALHIAGRQKAESCILQLAIRRHFQQVIDLQKADKQPMKGTLYALIWCGAPSLGAYTPMGISQYSRLLHPGIQRGYTRGKP